jgi:uncharacterized protein
MKFELYRRRDHRGKGWCWRLCGATEGIVVFGEGYASRADCLHAVELVRGTTSLTPIIENLSDL